MTTYNKLVTSKKWQKCIEVNGRFVTLAAGSSIRMIKNKV